MENNISSLHNMTELSLKLKVGNTRKLGFFQLSSVVFLLTTASFHGRCQPFLSATSQPTVTQVLSSPLSKLTLVRQLNTPHFLTIALVTVIQRIEQIRAEITKTGTGNLEQKFEGHLKKSEQEHQDKMLDRQMAKLSAIEASMAKYAALNDQAYELGKQTHETLVRIEDNLGLPIYERAAFKTGLASGKVRYNLAAMERGISQQVLNDTSIVTAEDDLLEADREAKAPEIKVSSHEY